MPPKAVASESEPDDDQQSSRPNSASIFSRAELTMLRTLSPLFAQHKFRVNLPGLQDEPNTTPTLIPNRREEIMASLDEPPSRKEHPKLAAAVKGLAASVAKEGISFRASCKIRLHHFFKKYEPSQLTVLDQWLDNWSGREEAMMVSLIEFHGPEPASHITVVPSGEASPKLVPTWGVDSNTVATARGLLSGCIGFYDPSRLGEVGSIMKAWKGQEHTLLRRLQYQFVLRDRITKWYQATRPDDENIGLIAARMYLGREQELLASLPDIQDTIVEDSNTSPSRRLSPQRRSEPPTLPPTNPTLQPNLPTLTRFEESPEDTATAKIYEFYAIHRPMELAMVPRILDGFKGSRVTLLNRLEDEAAKPAPGPDAKLTRKKSRKKKKNSPTSERKPAAPLKEPPAEMEESIPVEEKVEFAVEAVVPPAAPVPAETSSSVAEGGSHGGSTQSESSDEEDLSSEGVSSVQLSGDLTPPPAAPPRNSFAVLPPASWRVQQSHPKDALAAVLSSVHKTGTRPLKEILHEAGLAPLYPICLKEEIDLDLLKTLSVEDLRGVGVSSEIVLRRFVQFKAE